MPTILPLPGSTSPSTDPALMQDSHLAMNSFVELVGKVNPDLTLKVLASTDFGSNVDLDLNDAVVDATHRYHEIFYERPA